MKIPALALRSLKTEEDRALYIERYKNCSYIRELIAQVLTAELNAAILRSESETNLDSPNYDAKIADGMGYRRGLRLARDLLTSTTNEEP